MFHRSTPQSTPLAIVRDAVYSADQFEHLFDASTSEAHSDDAQVQAETDPHPLTTMALAGAGNPSSGASLPMTLSMLRQQYTAVIADLLALLDSSSEQAAAALLCARNAAAQLSEPFADLTVDDRYDIIFEWFRCTGGDTRAEEFWTLLSNILYGYAGTLMETGWVAVPGVVPDDDGTWSMPVWRTDTGGYVCDLLTFMTPWDTDEEIAAHVSAALTQAQEMLGNRLFGLRVLPVASGYLARWYFPDLSWLPLEAAMSLGEGRLSCL